jgi:epoxyqueuosine reductase
MGGWVFGCDICQQVCPWNEKAGEKPRSTPLFNVLPAINDLNASDILGLSPQEFNLAFKNTPIQRAKRSGLLRNAVVATGNLRSKDALPQLIDLLLHEQEALVRAHAAWAIGQFHSSDAIHALKTASRTEIDPAVLTEIEEALKQF